MKINEIVYNVGWGMIQEDNTYPEIVKMQCVKNMGNYYYMKTLNTDVKLHGRSGSAVVDKNG
ncbi:MAG: hypothetical protein HQ541_00670 [Mariniphaga sp.]|nr:hypothetical protein [Mariniphaga sp.]